MSERSQKTHPDVQEWLGSPPKSQGVVGRPTRMSGSGREAILDVRELSGGPPGSPEVVEGLFQMSGSGREALLDARDLTGGPLECQEVVERPPVCLGVVGGPSRTSGSCHVTLPNVREWSGGHSNVQEWSGDTSGCPGVVRRHSQMSLSGGRRYRISGSGWKTIPDVREWLGGPP